MPCQQHLTHICVCWVGFCDPRQTMSIVVSKVFEEASSHPAKTYISMDDFVSVITNTGDFEQSMIITWHG